MDKQTAFPKRQIVDIETWERKDNFNFFRNFLNPCITITSEVECTAAKEKAKKNGQSFFIHYLYAILRAANEIKELRFRVDDEGQIIYFETVDVLCPIRMKENGKFFTVRIPWITGFEDFHREARRIIASIPEDGDPYNAENLSSEENRYSVILVSVTPDLYFTSMTHTQERESGSSYPLLNVGKAVTREGKLVIPSRSTCITGLWMGRIWRRSIRRWKNIWDSIPSPLEKGAGGVL